MEAILVDDHQAMREGLKDLLERRGIRTVGVAGTAAAAVEILAEHKDPDVVVIDLNLPDESGLRLVRRLRAEHPELPIVIYTGAEDTETLAQALESGANGLVLKLGGLNQLVQALRLVARGGRYVDPTISAMLDQDDSPPLLLTKREREVFDLLAQGLTGEEIATRLTVSAETVRTHIRNGMGKLEARTRVGAVLRAVEAHEITP